MSLQSESSSDPDVQVNSASKPVRVMAARMSTWQRAKDVWNYRELLVSLTRKELKVKYKGSGLGFFWTLLNPALQLLVYYIAFQVILRNGIPVFAVYLLSGLLVWNLFSGALGAATGAIIANASIVGKVSFPREILPLASVGASLIHFLLQLVVLFGAMLVFQHSPDWSLLVFLVPATFVLVLLAAGFGLTLSAINVRYRDVSHLLDQVLFAWFWTLPIVAYTFARVAESAAFADRVWIYLLNPITPIVLLFQRVLYNDPSPIGSDGQPIAILPDESLLWYLAHLGYSFLFGLVMLWIGLRVFRHFEADFAEDL